MWKKFLSPSVAVCCLFSAVSCDKIDSLVQEVTGEKLPTERRQGIERTYVASIEDAKQWIAEPNVLVVLDFYSENCAPCKAMEPHLEALAKKYADNSAIMKLDVGKPGDVASAAINEYGVQGTPVLKFFFNGEEVEELKGAQRLEELEVVFKKYADKLIDGEFTMREGDLPGMNQPVPLEEMMFRVGKNQLPPGMERTKIPTDEKIVTDAKPDRVLNKTLDQPTRLTAPVLSK